MNAILFESISAPLAAGEDQPAKMSPFEVFQRVGALTRKLHDALHALGYDQTVGNAVSALPDARARLGYIANLTGRAAERVLTAAEKGKELQDSMTRGAHALEAEWKGIGADSPAGGVGIETMNRTRAFLQDIQRDAAATGEQLTDIILAQDFHDLTGQVINRVVALAQNLEDQLLKLLLETTPPEQRARLAEQPALAGPVIDAAGRVDVVTDQAQVDDLLESLGF